MGTAQAQDACGSVKLVAGQVQIGKPLTSEWIATDAGKRCLGDIVKELDRNRLVRAVTVAYRAPDAQREGGKALAAAKAVADALVAAGLPKNRVFAVAPRAENEKDIGYSIRYMERAPDNVVARVANLSGPVRLGADETTLRAAEPAMPLLADDLVDTGAEGKASIVLKDGSGVRLLRNTRIKLARMSFNDAGDRTVHIEVIRGQIEAEVRKAGQGSSFDASSRVAVASVRGTVFRFGADPDGESKMETLEGRVRLGSAIDPGAPAYEVPAGQGARVLSSGKVEPPQPLPATPTVIAPLHGPLPAKPELTFNAVPGAARYQVELARDADFLIEPKEYETATTTLELKERLASGKWYWRVTAKSAAGFSGAASKVYSFEVMP